MSIDKLDKICRPEDLGDGIFGYWFARELMEACGYRRWQSFVEFIHTARHEFEAQGLDTAKHFIRVSGAYSRIDHKLSWAACGKVLAIANQEVRVKFNPEILNYFDVPDTANSNLAVIDSPSPRADFLSDLDIHSLIDGWIRQEKESVEFPVDFEIAWQIAGYARKDNAKRTLSQFIENVDFSATKRKNPSSKGLGRSIDVIWLTCDAFKHFCLIAATDEGRQIRQYFIEAEKKWRLIQQHHPEAAQDVEARRLLEMQIALANAETEKAKAEENLLRTRQAIVTLTPEPIQQKILGYKVVEIVEYRDRIIKGDELIHDGTTMTKSDLCRRYGFFTRSGALDYKALARYIDNASLPPEAWESKARLQDTQELKREWISHLDEHFKDGKNRQLWLGE